MMDRAQKISLNINKKILIKQNRKNRVHLIKTKKKIQKLPKIRKNTEKNKHQTNNKLKIQNPYKYKLLNR
jgi:hypothetical protein